MHSSLFPNYEIIKKLSSHIAHHMIENMLNTAVAVESVALVSAPALSYSTLNDAWKCGINICIGHDVIA